MVTGIDIGEGVIEAAKRLGPGITFQVGDAEALEFDDATFDGVTSTFGVMFVARPAAAAGEIARITCKGGRLALATWLPGGLVEELFKLTRTFTPAPPAQPPPFPFEWSHEERARELLGGAFDLIMWQHLRRGLRTYEGACGLARFLKARCPRARIHVPTREVSYASRTRCAARLYRHDRCSPVIPTIRSMVMRARIKSVPDFISLPIQHRQGFLFPIILRPGSCGLGAGQCRGTGLNVSPLAGMENR